MTGSMSIGKIKTTADYYYAKDFDTNYGGEFIFFIEPLQGHDEYFFYAKKLENGKIEISGEAYITISDNVERHKRNAKKMLGGKRPVYYWLDASGTVIEKTHF